MDSLKPWESFGNPKSETSTRVTMLANKRMILHEAKSTKTSDKLVVPVEKSVYIRNKINSTQGSIFFSFVNEIN